MDAEEREWAEHKLKEKSEKDAQTIELIFVKHYAHLFDAVIREHYQDICLGCLDVENEHGCQITTAHLYFHGRDIWRNIYGRQRQETWKNFLRDVGGKFFKKDILKWCEEYDGVEERVAWNHSRAIHWYMTVHFKNPPTNSEPDFSDSDNSRNSDNYG